METLEWMKQTRQDRLSEVGIEPQCPFCGKPRVGRSDYIRCYPCGVNWLDEDLEIPNYLNRDPRVARASMATGTQNTAMPSQAAANSNA